MQLGSFVGPADVLVHHLIMGVEHVAEGAGEVAAEFQAIRCVDTLLRSHGPSARESSSAMTRGRRRNHSAVFKAKLAVDAIRGEKTLAGLAKLHDVHPTRSPTRSSSCQRAPPELWLIALLLATAIAMSVNLLARTLEAGHEASAGRRHNCL